MEKKEKKKTKSKLGALWAFLVGILLMLGVYVLFESAPNRLRSGSIDDATDTAETITDTVADTLTDIIKTGGVVDEVEEIVASPTVFLGVEVLPVDDVIAEQLSLPSVCGVLVNGVVDGSPAQVAGIQRGDCLISLGGEAIEDINGFRELIATYKPGDNVRIVYIRDGNKETTYAQLVTLPGTLTVAENTDSDDADWGVSLSDISSSLRGSLDIPADIDGIAILSVIPGGAADEAGLQPGDVVTGIDQTPVSSMDEFFAALAEDNDNIALLDVYSRGSVRYVPLDSSGIVETADTTPTQTQTLRQRMANLLTGGIPFVDDDDEEEEGPKGGKFAQDDVQLTTGDNPAFNRPSEVPGDENTGGTASTSGTTSSSTGMNRPTEVPPQLSSTNDTVLFIGLLILLILYLSYREYTRPPEVEKI